MTKIIAAVIISAIVSVGAVEAGKEYVKGYKVGSVEGAGIAATTLYRVDDGTTTCYFAYLVGNKNVAPVMSCVK